VISLTKLKRPKWGGRVPEAGRIGELTEWANVAIVTDPNRIQRVGIEQ